MGLEWKKNVDIFPARMSMYYMCSVPVEDRREYWIPCN